MREIRYLGDTFGVKWDSDDPNNSQIRKIVKGIWGRQYVRRKDYYLTPVTPDAAWALVRLLNKFDFDVSGGALGQLARMEEETNRMVEASRSLDADIDLPDLSLYPFQRAGIQYALDAKRTFIADIMGLGKTLQALAAIEVAQAYPAVVVCPGYAKLNWENEVDRWLPHRTQEVLYANTPADYDADITILNYDILTDGWEGDSDRLSLKRELAEMLAAEEAGEMTNLPRVRVLRKSIRDLEKEARSSSRQIILSEHTRRLMELKPQSVVGDEFHYCRNEGSQRTQGMYALARSLEYDKYDDRYFFGLTGTPTKHGRNLEYAIPLDIMGRLKEVFGGYWKFAYHYCNVKRLPDAAGGGITFEGAKNSLELNTRLRGHCYVRRLTEEITDLPPKRFGEVYLELTNAEEYRFASKDTIEWYREKVREDEEFLASIAHLSEEDQEEEKINRGNQAAVKASGAEMLIRMNALRRLSGQGKIKGTIDWIHGFLDNEGEKLVVAAWHRDVVEAIAKEFKAPKIMGGMNPRKVEENKRSFQEDPETRIIVINIESGGVSHTLTAAHHMIFVEYPWSPGDMDQTIQRAYARINDMHGIMVWRTIAKEALDVALLSILSKKRRRAEESADGLAEGESEESVIQEVLDEIVFGE